MVRLWELGRGLKKALIFVHIVPYNSMFYAFIFDRCLYNWQEVLNSPDVLKVISSLKRAKSCMSRLPLRNLGSKFLNNSINTMYFRGYNNK